MGKKIIDILIGGMFIVSLLASIAFIIYAGYAVINVDNATAFTSIALSCVCLVLSIATAVQFKEGGRP